MTSPSTSGGNIQSPPFDPNDFYVRAVQIAREGSSASFRTAIGRLYYALFLTARERPVLQDIMNGTLRKSGEGTHGHLIRSLKSVDRASALKLTELRMLRNVADYELDPSASPRASIRTRSDMRRNWLEAQTLVDDIYPKLKTL